ncbi:MAG TPA: BON domain-containing protein [Chloroflexota bacterium]|nr:BON domain-containing protein [Chloroflexota bacterium]
MATLRSDAEVRQDVSEALTCDVRIDASRISIDVVRQVVHLHGVVTSYFEKRVAGDLVRRIKGVRDVVNELRVVPRRPRSDAEIFADIRAALARDVWIDERRIEVRVVDGIVDLSGSVDTYTAKTSADADAWSVPGVVDVVDHIEVNPPIIRTDTEIANAVRADIDHNIRVNPQKITVAVTNGVVYLRGTVESLEQKWLAEEVSWWTAGVRDVVNQLQVEPTAFAQGGSS